jgi:hypothetical protein
MFVLTCVQPAVQAVSLMTGFRLTLKLTPYGRLVLEESSDAHELAPELGKRLQESFSRSSGFGLMQPGSRLEGGRCLPSESGGVSDPERAAGEALFRGSDRQSQL